MAEQTAPPSVPGTAPQISPGQGRKPTGLLRRAIFLAALWLVVVPAVAGVVIVAVAFALGGESAGGAAWQWVPWLFAIPVTISLLYVAAALTLSRIPLNTSFRDNRSGIPIAISNNGVHVDFHLPIAAAGHDWRQMFDPAEAGTHPESDAELVAIGWGDRDFFLYTPSWASVTFRTADRAVLGIGGTAVRANYDSIMDPHHSLHFTLTPAGYRRLVEEITKWAVLDKDGRGKPLNELRGTNAFYEAAGHYSALFTCNCWAASVLAGAGVRAPFWSPFSDAVMTQVRIAVAD
jgi:uncharacterized protein (TIGR02117 family)